MTLQFLDELAMAPTAALNGTLRNLVRVVEDGVGAVVEYELYRRNSRRELPRLSDYSDLPIVEQVTQLLDNTRLVQSNLSLQPIDSDATRIPPCLGASPAWMAFLKRAEVTAREAGFADAVASGLAGALGELADNVIQHSEAPDSGLAAFARTAARFEYVVADTGIGMLTSLHRSSEFRSLRDDLEALPLAVMPGISRHGRGVGYGFGYRAVFLPLRAASGSVRLRSGSAVLEIAGAGSRPDQGTCSQRPPHQGVTVSALVFPGSGFGP